MRREGAGGQREEQEKVRGGREIKKEVHRSVEKRRERCNGKKEVHYRNCEGMREHSVINTFFHKYTGSDISCVLIPCAKILGKHIQKPPSPKPTLKATLATKLPTNGDKHARQTAQLTTVMCNSVSCYQRGNFSTGGA